MCNRWCWAVASRFARRAADGRHGVMVACLLTVLALAGLSLGLMTFLLMRFLSWMVL